MAVSRHLGFYRTANSVIRSADPENPSLEPNMGSGSDAPFPRYSPSVTLKLGFGVTQGHRKWHHSIEHIRRSYVFHSNYASIYYRFRDIAAYWSKIATPLYLEPPLGVKPSDLRNDPWCRKTRMMGLSDSGRISTIRSAVLIQYTRVTDRRTDRQTDGRTELAWRIRAIAYMLSRVKTSTAAD